MKVCKSYQEFTNLYRALSNLNVERLPDFPRKQIGFDERTEIEIQPEMEEFLWSLMKREDIINRLVFVWFIGKDWENDEMDSRNESIYRTQSFDENTPQKTNLAWLTSSN